MICLQILLDLSERALYGGRNLTSAPTLVTSSTTWSTWWIDALSTTTMELEFWPLICRTNSKNWYRHLPLLQLKESQLQNNACLWGSRCVLMGVVLECHSHTFKAHFFDHTQSHQPTPWMVQRLNFLPAKILVVWLQTFAKTHALCTAVSFLADALFCRL